MTGKIFSKWDETHSELWNHQPIRLDHEMHKSPTFSMDELAKPDRKLSARALQPWSRPAPSAPAGCGARARSAISAVAR